jgi:hypothetical protein
MHGICSATPSSLQACASDRCGRACLALSPAEIPLRGEGRKCEPLQLHASEEKYSTWDLGGSGDSRGRRERGAAGLVPTGAATDRCACACAPRAEILRLRREASARRNMDMASIDRRSLSSAVALPGYLYGFWRTLSWSPWGLDERRRRFCPLFILETLSRGQVPLSPKPLLGNLCEALWCRRVGRRGMNLICSLALSRRNVLFRRRPVEHLLSYFELALEIHL